MERTFSKPLEARQVEARARARGRGVRVEVVSEARHYRTRSQAAPGTVYQVVRTGAGWACSCDGYLYTNCCKHIAQVERRAEREGWTFGKIAPLAQAEKHFPLDAAPRATSAAADLAALRERGRRAKAELFGEAAD